MILVEIVLYNDTKIFFEIGTWKNKTRQKCPQAPLAGYWVHDDVQHPHPTNFWIPPGNSDSTYSSIYKMGLTFSELRVYFNWANTGRLHS